MGLLTVTKQTTSVSFWYKCLMVKQKDAQSIALRMKPE